MNKPKTLIISWIIILITPVLVLLLGKEEKTEKIVVTTVCEETQFEEEKSAEPIVVPRYSNSSKLMGCSIPCYINQTEVESTPEETTEEETEEKFISVWTVENSNFRIYPEEDIIKVINKGTEITALNYNESYEWINVEVEGEYGFIKSELLSLEPVEPDPEPEPIKLTTYYYIVEGGQRAELSHELQQYGFDLINSLGMSEYIPYWICQCYQESRFTMHQSSTPHDGYYDWGIMQIWEGHQYDVWSPLYKTVIEHQNYKTDAYENIYCGIIQFYNWYVIHGGDIQSSLGSYFSGTESPNSKYISDVLSHMPNLYSYQE